MSQQMMSMKEVGIAAALREGNLRRAFELLCENFQEEIYRYCVSLVGSSSSLKVYDRILSALGEGLLAWSPTLSLRTWIYRVARQMVTQEHQRQRREGALAVDYIPVAGSDLSVVAADAPALDMLVPEVLEILQLSLWQGLRLEEVAQVVGRPFPTVRRLAAQGLGRLAAEHYVTNGGGGLPS